MELYTEFKLTDQRTHSNLSSFSLAFQDWLARSGSCSSCTYTLSFKTVVGYVIFADWNFSSCAGLYICMLFVNNFPGFTSYSTRRRYQHYLIIISQGLLVTRPEQFLRFTCCHCWHFERWHHYSNKSSCMFDLMSGKLNTCF